MGGGGEERGGEYALGRDGYLPMVWCFDSPPR